MVTSTRKRGSYDAGRRRRDALLQAAIRLVGERGAGAVSVDAVAAAAGVTKGSAYWHFAGKDALLEAAMGRALEAWTTEMLRHVLGQPSVEGRMTAVILAHAADLARPGSGAAFLGRVVQEPSGGRELMTQWRQRLRQVLGVSTGSAGGAVPRRRGLAEGVLCGLLGLGVLWDGTRDRLSLTVAAETLAAGLGAKHTDTQSLTETYCSVLF